MKWHGIGKGVIIETKYVFPIEVMKHYSILNVWYFRSSNVLTIEMARSTTSTWIRTGAANRTSINYWLFFIQPLNLFGNLCLKLSVRICSVTSSFILELWFLNDVIIISFLVHNLLLSSIDVDILSPRKWWPVVDRAART